LPADGVIVELERTSLRAFVQEGDVQVPIALDPVWT
jgi:hypothetical protein